MPKEKESIEIMGKIYPMKKSKYAINASPLHVSDDMSGKMSGIPSVSTSCLVNPICIARMKDGNSVCSHCFAESQQKRYKASRENSIRNFHLLNDSVLPLELLPRFANVAIVRIESFGDVASVTQAINYANLCKVNPTVTFAWWSKNMKICKKAFDIVGKPNNVIMVESSEKMNTQKERSCDIVDKVFTVYDEKTIAEKSVEINCGARCCATCRRCYSKETEAVVNEKLK